MAFGKKVVIEKMHENDYKYISSYMVSNLSVIFIHDFWGKMSLIGEILLHFVKIFDLKLYWSRCYKLIVIIITIYDAIIF